MLLVFPRQISFKECHFFIKESYNSASISTAGQENAQTGGSTAHLSELPTSFLLWVNPKLAFGFRWNWTS